MVWDVSIHLLWTGTLEALTPQVHSRRSRSFNPSFMDRYFRSLNVVVLDYDRVSFNPSFMDRYFRSFFMLFIPLKRVLVSIHLLWTGTLEDWIKTKPKCVRLGFNPSFMDRYFRSRPKWQSCI